MTKLLTQTLVLAIAAAITVTTFAQSPNNSTRQRRASADGTQQATAGPNPTDKANGASSDKAADAKNEKDKDQAKNPDVTADAKTNRIDESSEEDAIVPYYNTFFANYRLGPEDVVSINVFQQEKYSRKGVKVPPSGRIYLALIPEGLFVNGKTPDQVAEMIKKRYDE